MLYNSSEKNIKVITDIIITINVNKPPIWVLYYKLFFIIKVGLCPKKSMILKYSLIFFIYNNMYINLNNKKIKYNYNIIYIIQCYIIY